MATVVEKTDVDIQLLTGSEVMAHICRMADVDVITAYPIRPYDTVMQYVSKFIASGPYSMTSARAIWPDRRNWCFNRASNSTGWNG